MAAKFRDSFSGYVTADINTRYPGGSQNVAISNAILPPNAQAGQQSLVSTNNPNFHVQSDNFGAMARMTMRVRHTITNSGGVNEGFIGGFYKPGFSLGDPAIQIAGFAADRSGTYIYGITSALLATGPVIPRDEWHHYEFDVIFGNAANATLTIYLDGNSTPFLQKTAATLTDATGRIFYLGGGTASNGAFADYVCQDGTGAAPFNAPLAPQGLGGAKMGFAVANGAGHLSAWTANGAATIWQAIKDIPQDGDTSYASSATPGNAFFCTIGGLPPIQTMLGVQLSTYAREDDAGPRSYQSGFSDGAIDGYTGVDRFLAVSYNYIEDEFDIDPITGIAWSAQAAGLLATYQFGAKLIL